MINFIVLSTQRTGSTFLGNCLDSHPQIRFFEELFMPKNTKDNSFTRFRQKSLSHFVKYVFARQSLVDIYLEDFDRNYDQFEAVGFKFMYGQAERYPEVLSWCKSKQIKDIHLIRKNTLKRVV